MVIDEVKRIPNIGLTIKFIMVNIPDVQAIDKDRDVRCLTFFAVFLSTSIFYFLHNEHFEGFFQVLAFSASPIKYFCIQRTAFGSSCCLSLPKTEHLKIL